MNLIICNFGVLLNENYRLFWFADILTRDLLRFCRKDILDIFPDILFTCDI